VAPSPADDGYAVLTAIFLLALVVLSLAVAVPRTTRSLERDRELEALHRGKQYIRAIQLYYRKFHRYPPNLDALVNTNDIRFLRRKYADPITGKDDWKPILFGQNKLAAAMGFFGAELGGSTVAGIGPGGTGIRTPGGAQSSPFTTSQAGGGASPDSTNGQTFGGAGIVGFSIPSDKQSILLYKKQDHFNMWEFVYDPSQEMRTGGVQGGAGARGIGSTNGNSQAPGSLPGSPTDNPPTPDNPVTGNPPCGGQWSPNGNLPIPCS